MGLWIFLSCVFLAYGWAGLMVWKHVKPKVWDRIPGKILIFELMIVLWMLPAMSIVVAVKEIMKG